MRSRRNSVLILAAIAACIVLLPARPAAADRRTVIGHSVRGRPIVAALDRKPEARFRVLVIGCIHGNETAGMRVARRLIAAPAPPHTELQVIPTLNPVGSTSTATSRSGGGPWEGSNTPAPTPSPSRSRALPAT